MPKKHKPQDQRSADKRRPRRGRVKRPPLGVSVRRTRSGDAWTLVHPRCARDRADDLEEVRRMIGEGEVDIAIDELRWLVEGCRESIEAHRMLGELVLAEDNDVVLARAHFGYAYQLGLTALRRAGSPTPLPYRLPANQAFFEAGKGLAWCLKSLDKPTMAAETLQQLLECDPTDPLGLADVLASLK